MILYSLGVLAQLSLGAQAVPVLTRADPTAGAQARTELRVVAPVLFGSASLAGGRVMVHAMLNGEGLTMPGGELATGAWGEGFVDRRHPHTWLHEAMISINDIVRLPGTAHWSLSAGKGFAPYGTEDPMSRPAIVYPVNHHWSQVLERAVAIAGVSAGPVTLEAGVFNGDEPMGWNKWPNWDRFGDSWSARGFVRPLRGVEVEVSRAFIKSPEHRFGAGLDHTLWNASIAHEHDLALGRLRLLGEWSHADEEGAYRYSGLLGEAELKRGISRGYLRLERTERPEEQRVFGDDYRSLRPHNENGNLGTTRWTIVTAGVGHRLVRLPVNGAAEGVLEVAHINVTRVTGVVFDPAFFYGRNNLWMFSVALRITAGTSMHRMGRYGVAAAMPEHHAHGMMHE